MMPAFRNLPIRRKLTITVMLGFSLIVCSLSGFFIIEKIISFRRNIVKSCDTLATVIGANSTAALMFDVPATAGEILGALNAEPDVTAAGILLPSGRLFASYHAEHRPEVTNEVTKQFLKPFLKSPKLVLEGHFFTAHYLNLIKPIRIDDGLIGYVFIQMDLRPLNTKVFWFVMAACAITFCLFVSVLFLNKQLRKTIVDPLVDLTKVMQSVTQHRNYSLRAPQHNLDEMGILIAGFNDMLAQIEKRDEELETHRNHLEDMVAQRTTELLKANAQLKKEIEERNIVKEQLARAQKMEAVGTLAAGVAHDLNNVLSGIVTYPELLLHSLPADSSLRDPIETIRTSGEKAATIVQDLLALARRGVNAMVVLDLAELADSYFNSLEFKKMISYHPEVKIHRQYADDLLHIEGSQIHLHKCLMNLMVNAAEAMPDGGTITLTIENRYIDRPLHSYDHVQAGDYVVIMISDTGTGIAPEDLDRIFEPFYTKKKMGRSGTGLGMTIVWSTVRDHNGHIDIASSPENGTTITLYFPATRKQQIPGEKDPVPTDFRGNGESILVVDDVADQRAIATRILSFLGYEVHSVDGGPAALGFLDTQKVDLLVLDMIMDTGMDGLETYTEVIRRWPDQRAIIVSGFSESNQVKRTQALGAGAYVRKPYSMQQLGMAVKNELSH